MLARDRDEVIRVELTAGHVWMVVAAGLVFFMTPGLALFYGGMTRAKGVLNMMMMSLSLIHISEPTRLSLVSRMPSSA